jgi:2-haloacid dehalogenase
MHNESFVAGSIDAIVFDVIGTLVDEDTAWASAASRIAGVADVGDPVEFHRRWADLLESRMDAVVRGSEPWRPHQLLVSEAADEAIASVGGEPTTETSEWVSRIDGTYAAWPEVAQATAELRREHLVAGVSNGDLHSLARLSNSNSITWDIALSTGTARTFKPAPAAYRYAIDALAIDPGRTLFVAAHPWDLRAAAGHGFRTAYVERPGSKRPSPDDHFDLAVADLSALPRLLS